MIIGVPKEIKDHEYRVALTPFGVARLVSEGHQVLVQAGAGVPSGFADEDYVGSGAYIADNPSEVFYGSDMIVKVKEPLESEYEFLCPGLILFTYLHLAAIPALAKVLLEREVTGIAYETVELPDGSLPLLTPMSEVAGRLAIQAGAHYLEKPQGGSGILLAGVPGVRAGKVMVLGGGVVGTNAATVALGIGAQVTIITRSLDRLRYLSEVLHGNLETLASTPEAVAAAIKDADLVVGAVLIPGAEAPKLVTREMVADMKAGSVIVDVSVDQGGCIKTTRPTSYSNPVYEVDGVIHYCVTNMPGAVPHTSTQALCNATLPYMTKIARDGAVEAMKKDESLARGLNTFKGQITHEALGNSLGMDAIALEAI